jgi:uncharacterized protein
VAGAAAWRSVVVAPGRLQVNRRRAEVPGLPRSFDGYQIVHLSDLHIGSLSPAISHIESIPRLLPDVPDLFVVTGDLLERGTGIQRCAELLGSLHARDGVFVVLGNHEHRAERREPGHIDRLVETLGERGVHTLINDSAVLRRGASRLWLVGVDDPHGGRDESELALSKVPESEPAVLLAHSPDVFLRFPTHRVRLAFTGHCHGGQVRTPWGPIITQSKIRTSDVLGLQNIRGVPVNMSGGIGSTIPLRVLCPPEFTVLTLSTS